jgi:hypothetical protein
MRALIVGWVEMNGDIDSHRQGISSLLQSKLIDGQVYREQLDPLELK